MSFLVRITVEPLSGRTTDETFDAIADALFDCADIDDADLSSDNDENVLIFEFLIDEPDPAKAVTDAIGVVRTALHVAGGSTPNWENEYRLIRQSSETSDRLVGAAR